MLAKRLEIITKLEEELKTHPYAHEGFIRTGPKPGFDLEISKALEKFFSSKFMRLSDYGYDIMRTFKHPSYPHIKLTQTEALTTNEVLRLTRDLDVMWHHRYRGQKLELSVFDPIYGTLMAISGTPSVFAAQISGSS